MLKLNDAFPLLISGILRFASVRGDMTRIASCGKNLAVRLGAFLIILTAVNSYATLSEQIGKSGYPEIKGAMSSFELAEYDRIQIRNNTIGYDRPLIVLYLVASGVQDDNTLQKYLSQYNALLKKAKAALSAKKLNRYNTAEYLLHFLHDEILRNETAVRDNGFNVGILETFEKNSFNCYKSALLYNAFLESFGYESHYVLVPMHIYSVVSIDGLEIEVETTNRYGFDPYNRGGDRFARAFDKSGVVFDKRTYREKQNVDAVSVVNVILNSRLLLYSGEVKHSTEKVGKNYYRAAALGIAALNINPHDNVAKNNIQNVLYRITEESAKKDRTTFIRYYELMRDFIMQDGFRDNNANSLHNLSVLAVTFAANERKAAMRTVNDLESLGKCYMEELAFVDSYATKKDVHDNAVHNALIDYYNDAQRYYNADDLRSIEYYAGQMKAVFYGRHSEEKKISDKYKSMGARFIIVAFNTHVTTLMRRKEYEAALRAAEHSIDWLSKNEVYENDSMRILEKNHAELKRISTETR